MASFDFSYTLTSCQGHQHRWVTRCCLTRKSDIEVHMRAYLAISWLGEVVISSDHRTGIHPLEHHLWHERKVRAERRKTLHRLVVVAMAMAVVVVVVIVGRASVRRMYFTPSSTGSPSW